MKKTFMILIFTISSISQAIDLSSVSNADLITELSRRLGSGGNTGGDSILSASCTSGEVRVELYNQSGQQRYSKYVGSSECPRQIKSLSGKMGSFSGRRLLAICNTGELTKLIAAQTGALISSSDYVGTSECQSQADAINSSN